MAGVSFRRFIEERFAKKIEKAVSQKHKASIYLPLYNEENTGEIERTDWHAPYFIDMHLLLRIFKYSLLNFPSYTI